MLRITILAAALAASSFAQTAEELFNRPPADVDKALRARITEFYGYHISGEFRKAEALVAEDTKDFYYSANKPSYTKCEIRSVKYAADFEQAKAIVLCGMILLLPGFTDKPLDVPIGSTWKLEGGKWMWYISQEARRASPFGQMTPGPASKPGQAPPGGLPPMPQTAEEFGLYSLVKPDKTEVTVIHGSGAEVTITNNAPGVMHLQVTGKIQGIEGGLDKSTLNANEKAVLTILADPAAVSGTLQVVVSPIQQVIPIHVTVK